jgi:hypothetical protein
MTDAAGQPEGYVLEMPSRGGITAGLPGRTKKDAPALTGASFQGVGVVFLQIKDPECSPRGGSPRTAQRSRSLS